MVQNRLYILWAVILGIVWIFVEVANITTPLCVQVVRCTIQQRSELNILQEDPKDAQKYILKVKKTTKLNQRCAVIAYLPRYT